jgi:hypothetical protein
VIAASASAVPGVATGLKNRPHDEKILPAWVTIEAIRRQIAAAIALICGTWLARLSNLTGLCPP